MTPEEVDQAVDPDDAFGLIDELVEAGRGRGVSDFRRALVDREYARLVDRYLFELPSTDESEPDLPLVPTTVGPWEFGEAPSHIDWVESVARHGPMAGARPMRREYETDEPRSGRSAPTALEIYLDTSGSMPDPSRALNAMTLAAQILSAAAIRDEGRVRAVIYSAGSPMVTDWMYDEELARRQLLHFTAAGTQFPYDALEANSEDEPEAIRVIISDDDFVAEMRHKEEMAAETLERAVERSHSLIMMLANWRAVQNRSSGIVEELEEAHSPADFQLLGVRDVSDLGSVTARLSDALFDCR
ncbi:MAG: hypothetical protein ABEN55_14830 [Bradymonadaceae bacterium]